MNEQNFEKLRQETEQQTEQLPILAYKEKIRETVLNSPNTIIVGETGSGKTTQIPLILYELLDPNEKIAITQPRRVATRGVARYVAKKLGCQIGEEVGYQVRFDDRTTEGTRINFMTDGILLRKIQEDPLLNEYSVVMIDEAHERSLNIDLVLGLLRKIQEEREKAGLSSLKILVSSATLEKEKFARYFGQSPIIEVPGRLFPVDIYYEEKTVYNYPKAAAEKVKMILETEKTGDILIFMPGWEEIQQTINEIKKLEISEDVEILPLHGEMDPEEQDKIFNPGEKRRIIVATNIAETSVTVPRISYIIDSGLIKETRYDSQSGIEALLVTCHSKSGCIQRAGRAGRLGPGKCWRLYTKEDFEMRPPFQMPEIQRTNLAHIVLIMKKIGIEDVKSFDFIDPPPVDTLENAIQTLKNLGALDDKEKITPIGELMAEIPLEPHLSRMVIEAEKYNCVEEVCTIASFFGNRSVFVRPKGKEAEAEEKHRRFRFLGSDFLTLLQVWQEYQLNNFQESWARENFLNPKVLNEVRNTRYQIFRILRRNGISAKGIFPADPEMIAKSITAGFIDNLMEEDRGFSYRRVKTNEGGFFIHPSSVIFEDRPQLFVSAGIVRTTKNFCRLNQTVKTSWLKEIAPHLIEEKVKFIYFDDNEGEVKENVEIYVLGGKEPLVIEKRIAKGEEAVKIFAEILVERKIKLDFVKENHKTVKLINDLWQRGAKFSSDSPIAVPITPEDLKNFYIQRLNGISSKKELEKALKEGRINLFLNIDEIISPEEREKTLKENPDFIEIQGKNYQIRYHRSVGDDSVLEAEICIPLSEIFQLEEMPTLPSGTTILIKVVEDEKSSYHLFGGKDLDELKKKTRNFLIKKKWEEWFYQNKDRIIKRFDFSEFIESLPPLPPPVEFGKDPLTDESLLAFPYFHLESSYYSKTPALLISYSHSAEEAEAKNQETIKAIEELKIKEQKRKEAKILSLEAQNLLTVIDQYLAEIFSQDYGLYGLSYNEKEKISTRIREIKFEINISQEEPEKIKELISSLEEIKNRLEEAIQLVRKEKTKREKIKNAIKEYYKLCPLCNNPLEGKTCEKFHNIDRLNLEPEEESKNQIVLSQIVTDTGKIVARLVIQFTKRRGSKRWYVDLLTEPYQMPGENVWKGEDFESLEFIDFGKVLDEETAEKIKKEKARKEAIEKYKKELEFAEAQVREGFWKKGKFSLGKHPKTGDPQWEMTFKRKGILIKFIVDIYSYHKPTSEENVYFFSEVRKIVDTPSFQLIIVRIEPPFPEEKPEGFDEEFGLKNEEKEEKTSSSSPSLTSLEELKRKWGAK